MATSNRGRSSAEERAKEPEDKIVVFVPNTHSIATTGPSGAVFSFNPGVSVKVLQSDAKAFTAEGLGAVQGG